MQVVRLRSGIVQDIAYRLMDENMILGHATQESIVRFLRFTCVCSSGYPVRQLTEVGIIGRRRHRYTGTSEYHEIAGMLCIEKRCWKIDTM